MNIRLPAFSGALFALACLIGLSQCKNEEPSPASPAPVAEEKPAPAPVSQPQPTETKPVSEMQVVKVVMETSKGTIELELDPAKAPITVENFVKYAKKAHYDGLIFHRVIPGFMIQGGGFNPDMSQKSVDAPISIESKNGLKNSRGTIAMARTNDPNSATSQFFINVKDNDNLDYPSFDGYGYAVFGKVTKGLEICDAIVSVPTTRVGPHGDVPAEPIVIKSVKIAE